MQDTFNPIPLLVEELNLPVHSITAVIQLLKEGNTVPFISRYRKEITGNLDEVQIRAIQDRLNYITELEDRKQVILKSISDQGKLTPELQNQITACITKTELEDLYLPYKPKRRSRALIAREKGLEPLALHILSQPPAGLPEEEAEKYIDGAKGVADVRSALAGARDIIAEQIAEAADIRAYVRDVFKSEGEIVSQVLPDRDKESAKFEQYYDFRELIQKIPSHRYLAIRRGEQEGVLRVSLEVNKEPIILEICRRSKQNLQSPFASQLQFAIEDAYKRLIAPGIETDIRVDLKMKSDADAVEIFAQNLRNLLLSAPLGERNVIGIDPGFRTGCKCAAVDSTGKYLDTITIYPSQSKSMEVQSKAQFLQFLRKYHSFAIAIGNGTASRETESFIRQTLAEAQIHDIIVVTVSEAGASIYSASDIAREEFPDLDLTIRGAISIARRLQDPLAELVKLDPKSIGVGQYQHDVYQQLLQDKLHNVVESCVNHVGVELNTASASLLSYVAGIGEALAKRIVQHREKKGAFQQRQDLLSVKGLGEKTFEQAAGFLRIREGKNPLDASAVHPERYPLVEKISQDLALPLQNLVGKSSIINTIELKKYINSEIGELTLRDIIEELKKPGRDPRATFEQPKFREDVVKIEDLQPGMKLEGIVTNVTAFGAFVDIGVHQDGLVHISELSDHFIKDPHEVVRTGDKIKVTVLECDSIRKRISLSAKSGSPKIINSEKNTSHKSMKVTKQRDRTSKAFNNNPFANL